MSLYDGSGLYGAGNAYGVTGGVTTGASATDPNAPSGVVPDPTTRQLVPAPDGQGISLSDAYGYLKDAQQGYKLADSVTSGALTDLVGPGGQWFSNPIVSATKAIGNLFSSTPEAVAPLTEGVGEGAEIGGEAASGIAEGVQAGAGAASAYAGPIALATNVLTALQMEHKIGGHTHNDVTSLGGTIGPDGSLAGNNNYSQADQSQQFNDLPGENATALHEGALQAALQSLRSSVGSPLPGWSASVGHNDSGGGGAGPEQFTFNNGKDPAVVAPDLNGQLNALIDSGIKYGAPGFAGLDRASALAAANDAYNKQIGETLKPWMAVNAAGASGQRPSDFGSYSSGMQAQIDAQIEQQEAARAGLLNGNNSAARGGLMNFDDGGDAGGSDAPIRPPHVPPPRYLPGLERLESLFGPGSKSAPREPGAFRATGGDVDPHEHARQYVDDLRLSGGLDGMAMDDVDAMLRRAVAAAREHDDPAGAGPLGIADLVEQAAVKAGGPSEAQKKAGNYYKPRVKLPSGLDFAIETARDGIREGVGPDGQPWSTRMPETYGYLRGTKGADGDALDAYVGRDPTSDKAFVVDQGDPVTGAFDEHKILLHHPTIHDAIDTYDRGYSDGSGPDRRMGIAELSIPELKRWIKQGDTTQPIGDQVARGGALAFARGGAVIPEIDVPEVRGGEIPSGSYILPADIVVAKGDGSSTAGARVLHQEMGALRIMGPGDGRSDSVQTFHGSDGTPIDLSIDEMLVLPPEVEAKGGADKLDRFVLATRAKYIRHLDGLPGPKR